jgi:hypothetical protein
LQRPAERKGVNTVFLRAESSIQIKGGRSSKEEKQKRGDLFGGGVEITFEETDKK